MPSISTIFRYGKLGVVSFTLGAAAVISINDYLFEITTINGASMSPTLSPDYESQKARDCVLFDKFSPTKDLRRGDLVLFSAPHKPEDFAVKRVVATGGDTVLLDPRRRPQEAINGRVNPHAHNWEMWGGRVVIPPGHVWVEGDNWRSTVDSNTYGPISKQLIVGKAMMLIWPWRQLGATPWHVDPNKTKVEEGIEVFPPDSESPVLWKPVDVVKTR